MDQNQGIRTWQWVVTVIVIIILIVLGYYLFKGNGTTPSTNNNGAATSTPNTAGTGANRITIADQYPGNVVYVSSAQFEKDGWVVIHKDNAGTPGAVIGSMYFAKGINPGKITLTENTANGQLYYAMLHSDDGDKKFDIAKDLPLKDANGSAVMKTFRASTDVTEIKG